MVVLARPLGRLPGLYGRFPSRSGSCVCRGNELLTLSWSDACWLQNEKEPDMKKPAPPSPSPSLKSRMVGMWWLESRIDLDPAGQRRIDPVMGADPLGIVCFAADRFSAQFMRRDRSQAAPPSAPGAPANNSSAVNGYDAYFGTYTVDEKAGTMRTTLEGAVTPTNIGGVFERHVAVADGKLTIRLTTTAPDGTAVTRTLTFVRLS
jgi:hypothetical protein